MAVWITIPINFKIANYQAPRCLYLADPEYPREALEMGMEGWVGLAVYVDAKGEVDNGMTTILGREPRSSTAFDSAAKMVALRSRFAAGSSAGWCFIKVPFTIKEH
jgi:TonB family protein